MDFFSFLWNEINHHKRLPNGVSTESYHQENTLISDFFQDSHLETFFALVGKDLNNILNVMLLLISGW